MLLKKRVPTSVSSSHRPTPRRDRTPTTRRLAMMLLVCQDVVDSNYSRPATHRGLLREHVDAAVAALSSHTAATRPQRRRCRSSSGAVVRNRRLSACTGMADRGATRWRAVAGRGRISSFVHIRRSLSLAGAVSWVTKRMLSVVSTRLLHFPAIFSRDQRCSILIFE